MKRLSLLLVILIMSAALWGCWDKIEIEQRLFVLAMGIDKIEEEQKSIPEDRYVVSFVSPVVGALMGNGDTSFHTYKTTGKVFSVALNNMYTRFAKSLSFEHTRVLIFGEELLRDEELFKEALDSIGRSHEFHKSMYVFAVRGKAAESFELEPKYEKLLAMYISGLADNYKYEDRIAKQAAYEMYSDFANNNGNTLIPRLIAEKDEAKVTGVAVIKNFKLLGFLSGTEYKPLSWIMGEGDRGLIEVEHEGIYVPFEYNELNRKLKLDKVEGDKVFLTINLESEGALQEYIWGRKLLDQKLLRAIEEKLEKKIVALSESALEKFQQEYQMDVIGIRDYLIKFHPDVYEALKDDYETKFKDNISVKINAEVNIRRVGVTE